MKPLVKESFDIQGVRLKILKAECQGEGLYAELSCWPVPMGNSLPCCRLDGVGSGPQRTLTSAGHATPRSGFGAQLRQLGFREE